MEFTEKALVVATGRFREADLWVRLLGPGHGLYQAFAFGGCKSRRRFGGCLDPFNLLMVHVASDKQGRYLQLKETGLLCGYPRLRTDLSRLGMAANCLKFAEAVQDGAQSAPAVFESLCGLLRILDTAESVPDSLPLFFRARLLGALGFWPELASCHVCGKGLHDMTLACFGVESGRLACSECGRTISRRVPLGSEAVDALRFIVANPPEEWGCLDLSGTARRECFAAVDRFIEHHLGIVWDAGRYKRS